jgi:hypothetical protein
MRLRIALAAVVSTAAVVVAVTIPTGAHPLPLPLGITIPAHPNSYVDPFANSKWEPARTDMGVDWIALRRLPVLAIGDAVILGSENHTTGWPGHRLIWYQLLDGSHAGDVVYVAEHLRKLLPAGTIVWAGQRIAFALPGFPDTEWGWADLLGAPRAAPCYKEGRQTNSGKEMARFMESLGAQVSDAPGRGPDSPAGRLC